VTKRVARNFRLERYAIIGFMAFYIFNSQFVTPRINDQEIYPFFQWSLHSTVDNTHKFIQVRLTRIPGESSCLLQNCAYALPPVRSTRFYFLVQDMGRVQNSDPSSFEEMRGQLEAILRRSTAQTIRYELIEAKATPREFAKGGEISLGRVIYQGIVAP
jgi:hypothetical protein